MEKLFDRVEDCVTLSLKKSWIRGRYIRHRHADGVGGTRATLALSEFFGTSPVKTDE